MLAAGANVESANEDGETSLHSASQNGHLGVVETLLAAGADFEESDCNEKRPLNLACEQGHRSVVKRLLAVGANFDARDDDGMTPLYSQGTSSIKLVVGDWQSVL